MNVAERFGKINIDVSFKPTQMIALLSLPDAEETEKFIEAKAAEGKKVADMTIKQLREEIAAQVVSFIRRLMTSGHDDGKGALVTGRKRYRMRRI